MRGIFCNCCGKHMRDDAIIFHGAWQPMQGSSAVRDDPCLFNYVEMDLCPECFRREVDRMAKEYKLPPIERSGDGTRYKLH